MCVRTWRASSDGHANVELQCWHLCLLSASVRTRLGARALPSAATSAAGLAGGSETDTSACAAASRPWSDGTLNVARAGATDPVGLRAEQNKVHVHDLHATILHALGIDHENLTYFHNGRDERLTDVGGRVVTEIFA